MCFPRADFIGIGTRCLFLGKMAIGEGKVAEPVQLEIRECVSSRVLKRHVM
jgi:hypothetical protein